MNAPQIINNARLMIAIQAHFHQQKITEKQFIKIIADRDHCIGFISELKVSPFYFNKSGKKLAYLFIDIKTLKISPVIKADGRKVVENTKENQMEWGN